MITNEMKLSKEQTAKVFALHLGCEIYVGDGHIATLVSAGLDEFNSIEHSTGSYGQHSYHGEEKLILTPLSEITDEDANRCYADLGYSHEGSAMEDILSAFYGIPKLLTNLYSPYDIIRITDWLRQNGFAIDYMGIDLFESGIAIPKK